ncbi:MAG: thermonuclease family protein [Myxococcota bacterium]
MILLICLSASWAHSPALPVPTNGTIVLDGKATQVQWDDGDTFFVPHSRTKARLDGYNTLESYGAVHRIGDTENEHALFGTAKAATELAKSQSWVCATQDGDGGYGRVRVDCPELRKAMLTQGLAHPFSVSGPAPEADLQAQQVAINARVGIWSQGAPEGLVTSLHSITEKEGATESYNRILDVKTGEASKRVHSNTYEACTWVCPEGQGSCMLYVPYKERYGASKAACLVEAK